VAHRSDTSRVAETTTSTTTGPLALAGALTGFCTFASIPSMTVGDTVWYALWAVDASGNATGDFEAGLGTYSAANQLTRTTILESSNAGAAVNLTSGTKIVALASLASRTVQLDQALQARIPLTPGVAAVPANTVGLFCKSIGGRMMLGTIGPSGLDSVLQPHVGRNGIARWTPAGTGTTIQAEGAAALTATGTATAAVYATTSLHTRCRRIDYLTTPAAATAVAGYRAATNAYRTNEGFHHIFRVSPATGGTVGTRRFFVGMAAATAAPTDVQPSSQVNIAGAGYDAADGNWQFMFNDASGTATKVDTGVARPSTDRPSVYTVSIFCPPGGGSIGVTFTDEAVGTPVTSVATTDLIAASTTVGPRAYHSVGGTSSVVGLTLFSGYMESDN
jgi:hypothetical protein